MREMYRRIAETREDSDVQIRLSYLEIYNEAIRDLLSPTPTPPGQGLMLREDATNKISVVGITEHAPDSPEQVLQMIQEGNLRRTMSPTEANAVSSRSHAVLQINVTQRPRTADTIMETTSASLNIIDLAGSERAAATNNNGARMKEGANINKSLLALGNCINALCQSGGRKGRHIPYRNSKLTRLLKFSLGGNCKTVMIVCVSPSSSHYDETYNTLKYANQAKNIRTKVSRNMLNVDRHVAQYVQAIHELKEEVEELKKKISQGALYESDGDKRRKVELKAEVEETKARMRNSTDNVKTLVTQKGYVNGLFTAAKIRLEAVHLRLQELQQIQKGAEQDSPGSSEIVLQSQFLSRLADKLNAILSDRTLQMDLHTLNNGLQTHREVLLSAGNNIKFDRDTEKLVRLYADNLFAEVDALKVSVSTDAMSKQFALNASLVTNLCSLSVESNMALKGAAAEIASIERTKDDPMDDIINHIRVLAERNDESFIQLIGLRTSDSIAPHCIRRNTIRRVRASYNGHGARVTDIQRRMSFVPANVSLAGNTFLGSKSPRRSTNRRSMTGMRRSNQSRASGVQVARSASNSTIKKSCRWADEDGEEIASRTDSEQFSKVDDKKGCVAAPSVAIRTSLSNEKSSDISGHNLQSTALREEVERSKEDKSSKEQYKYESDAQDRSSIRTPLAVSSASNLVESRKDSHRIFANDFLRKKNIAASSAHSPEAMDVDLSSDSFDASDLDLVLRDGKKIEVMQGLREGSVVTHADDGMPLSRSSDDVVGLSSVSGTSSVRSSPYRKPRTSNDDGDRSSSRTIGPIRNSKARGASVVDTHKSTSVNVAQSSRRTIRSSNASATSAAAAAARATRPSQSQQPFPLRKVPPGGIHANQHEKV